MRKARRKHRAKEAAAEGDALGQACPTCGVAWEAHPVCAACGILAGGPLHAPLSREPFGQHEICSGCFVHLRRCRLQVERPWRPDSGSGGVVTPARRGAAGIRPVAPGPHLALSRFEKERT